MMTGDQKSRVAALKARIAARWGRNAADDSGGSRGVEVSGSPPRRHHGARSPRRLEFTRARCVAGSERR
jgi:hypothetical protein